MNLFDVLFAKKLAGGGSPFPPVIKRVTGNPVEFSDGADAPLVKCVTAITGYQEGSGTPSPDNVRPITAYTEGEIEVRGKNLFDKDYGTVDTNKVISATGELTNNDYFSTSDYISINGGNNYTIQAVSTNPYEFLISQFDSNKTFINRIVVNYTIIDGIMVGHFSTDSVCAYVKVSLSKNGALDTARFDTMQIEKGSTPTDYEPYTSTTHTTTYPSVIYRGSEDVVNGTATTEWGMIASYAGETLPGEWISDRDEYAPGTTPTTGAQVAYELATPTTSSVTPTNLPIKSLSGYNHIESSTGDMTIDYITDQYQNFVDTTERAIPSTRKG